MKKFLLLLIPIVLTLSFIACDLTSEDELSKGGLSQAASSSLPSADASYEQSEDTQPESNESSDEISSPSFESSELEISDGSSSVSDPDEITEKEIDNISVVIKGTSALENAGYKITSEKNFTVSVVVRGEQSFVNTLSAANISATVDVSNVCEECNEDFLIEYSADEGVEMISFSKRFITLKIEKKSGADDPDISIPPVSGDAYIAESGIIISGNRGMEAFGGGASAGQQTAEKLNTFKAAVGENVNVYILPAPIASAFYAPEKYPNSINNHINCFNGLKDALAGVKYVDTLGALSTHTDEDIYFRTDHHWQALGAYYAARQLALVAETPFDDLSLFIPQSEDGIVGSLYGYSQASVLKNNPDTMVWYVPTREYTVTYYSRDNFTNPKSGLTLFSSNSGYTKFIYGDSYTTHIKSNVGNGRKLLIFKDSFGNALAPFLIGSFDEVYVADFRYFDLNAKTFIEEQGITDVCFSMAAFSVAGSKRDNITRLLKN